MKAPDIFRKSNILIDTFGIRQRDVQLMFDYILSKLSSIDSDEIKGKVISISRAEFEECFFTQKDKARRDGQARFIEALAGIKRLILWQSSENGNTIRMTSLFGDIEIHKDGTRGFCEANIHISTSDAAISSICTAKNRYTLLSLSTIGRLKNAGAIRLYEFLKCHAFRYDKITTSFAELRLVMGAAEQKKSKIAMSYEYKDGWHDFRKNILNTAIKEINENTEIQIQKCSKSHSCDVITFVISKTENELKERIEEKRDIIHEIKGYNDVAAGFSDEDIYRVIEVAEGDLTRVKNGLEYTHYMCINGDNPIENKLSYVKKAIIKGWEISKAKSKPKRKKSWESKQEFSDELLAEKLLAQNFDDYDESLFREYAKRKECGAYDKVFCDYVKECG